MYYLVCDVADEMEVVGVWNVCGRGGGAMAMGVWGEGGYG